MEQIRAESWGRDRKEMSHFVRHDRGAMLARNDNEAVFLRRTGGGGCEDALGFLALLANGMLKGKALSDFISRSAKVVEDAYLK
ncbi:MAG: hypothetical protein ACI3ZL_07975 [Candidatus Cryptobacteroides sp.]